MRERSTAGALGLVGALLAIAALAHLRPSQGEAVPQPAEPAPKVRPAAAVPSIPQPAALAALREGEPLDLNHAMAGDLELLPGIGPKLAQRIVDDRAARGAYRSVEQLVRVRGVGPRTLKRLRPLVRVERDAGGHGQGREATRPLSDRRPTPPKR